MKKGNHYEFRDAFLWQKSSYFRGLLNGVAKPKDSDHFKLSWAERTKFGPIRWANQFGVLIFLPEIDKYSREELGEKLRNVSFVDVFLKRKYSQRWINSYSGSDLHRSKHPCNNSFPRSYQDCDLIKFLNCFYLWTVHEIQLTKLLSFV